MAKTNKRASPFTEAADGDNDNFPPSPSNGALDIADPTSAPPIKKEEFESDINSTPPGTAHIKSSRSSSSSSQKKPVLDDIGIEPKSEKYDGKVSPVKSEMPKAKSGRSAASKAPPRIAPLFADLPDATAEATSSFQVINSSTYQNKYLGLTESALECDCSEEWNPATRTNDACGDTSDCINRACKMECSADCNCGEKCQNQRFTRRMYANVSVIQTEKKGYGLRTDVDLRPNDFIFEYIGEVIAEGAFRKRMVAYDQEGIKHFYFMSLSRGEFVDATKRGNLGRFCNHSCNPNCFVDKWVVGDKLRMGIFAERYIKAGEELVFNYNVDRYGANPQPCYCGESNCTGFIGGKTQTERGTKLSAATIEALGIDDDEWDTVVAKKPKKKKATEDDEDYVDSVPARVLDADSVTKVMAALMQCKEKWIAVKLFERIQNSDDELVRGRIIKLHGYRILNSQLSAWKDDENLVLQILDILDKLPRLTRNKIVDARLDQTLETLSHHEDERVATRATALADAYSKLELAYRIPRRRDKDDASTPMKTEPSVYDRREVAVQRRRSRSRSKSPPRGPAGMSAPTGPKSVRPVFQPRPFPRPAPAPLPRGWKLAYAQGRAYYYTDRGVTTWQRPTQPAEVPPPPPREPSQQDVLKGILEGMVKRKDDADKTPESNEPAKKEKKEEKWKSYDEEKKMKLYENTLFPHISHVANKYKHKIPRDDLKRFAKEIAKKLVASDFKSGRAKDPTKVDEKQQRKIKDYCKQFFDKAAHKHKKTEEERSAKKSSKKDSSSSKHTSGATSPPAIKPEYADADEDIKMSDHELDEVKATPDQTPLQRTPSETSQNLKRKRDAPSPDIKQEHNTDTPQSPLKKPHLDDEETTSNGNSNMTPPPPPPPPPDTPLEMTPNGSTPAEYHRSRPESANGDTEMEIDPHDKGDVADTAHDSVENGAPATEVKLHLHTHDAQGHGQESNFKDMSLQDVKKLAQLEGDEDGVGADAVDLGEDEVEW